MGRISRGFTLVEMIVVAPVIILSIGAFIAAIVHMTGEVMSSRGSNTVAYEVQDTLNRIEQDIKLSIAFLPETSVDFSSSNPQGLGEDGTGKFENVSSSGTNALILATPATNGNPLSEDVGYIYMENTPNSCASGQYANNIPLITNVVYFVDDNDVLWRRTIMPVILNNLCGGVPWQQASCSPGRSHAFCATEDIKLLEGVSGSGFSLEYFTDSTAGSSNADASNPSLNAEARRSALESSQAVYVSISSNKSIAGRDISHTGSLTRVSRVDTNRTSISELGSTYGSSTINIDSGYIGTTDLTGQSPELNGYVSDYTDVVFDWGQLDGADKYYPQYRISTDGGSTWGSWSNATHSYSSAFPPHVRSYKVTDAHHGDKIEFRVRGSNLNGQSSYATKQITIPVWVPLQLQNGWSDYNGTYSPPAFTKTRSGMVMVRGMIKGGTNTHATVVATLPVGYRPSGTLLFTNTTASNVYARIDVVVNGEIRLSGSNISATWTSIDTIRFIPSDTSYTPTTATLAGGFTHYGGSFENVRYFQDSVGRVHLQGLARSGSTVASGTQVVSIPAALRPSQFQLHSGNSTAYQHLGINTTAGVETRANGTVNNHSSMNMRWLPASHTDWKNLCNGNTCDNGWIYYGPSFTTPQYSKTADNVVNLKGLLKSGTTTAGTQMALLPENCRPNYRIMYSTASANAHTRIEIAANGQILFTGGSNSWMSLDNITFIASKNGPC